MNPRRLVVVTLLLALAVSPPASAQSTTPPGWTATESKVKELLYDERAKEAIALLEPVVKAHPRFADGHLWLGTARESMGRTQAATNAMAALPVLDAALGHFQQAFDLGGGATPELSIRALVDLQGLLRKTAERRKTITAAIARFPGLPVVHRYAVEQAIEDGADMAAPLKAARTGLAATDVGTRLDFADDLARLAANAPPTPKRALITEAQAIVAQAAKAKPGDRRVTAHIGRVNEQLALATAKVDRGQGPPANEAGAQSTLRAIVSAQLVYTSVCAPGFYAATFDALGRAPADGSGPYLPADLVPAGGGRVLERYGYRIELTATPDTSAPRTCNGVAAGGSSRTFAVIARPMAGRSGRAFRIDHSGTLTAVQ